MKNLQQALYARWLSTAGATLRGLATGGFHIAQAKQGAVAPYIVMTPLASGDTDGASSTDAAARIDAVRVQFSIFTDDGQLDQAYSIRDALVALFDGYMPTAPSPLRVHGVYRRSPGFPLKDPDEGWQVVIEYEYRTSGL